MGMIRVTLYDFDEAKDETKPPITAELEYDENMSLTDQGVKKVAICGGNNVCAGTVIVPLGMLTHLVSLVIAKSEQNRSPIIMPDNKIIRPN